MCLSLTEIRSKKKGIGSPSNYALMNQPRIRISKKQLNPCFRYGSIPVLGVNVHPRPLMDVYLQPAKINLSVQSGLGNFRFLFRVKPGKSIFTKLSDSSLKYRCDCYVYLVTVWSVGKNDDPKSKISENRPGVYFRPQPIRRLLSVIKKGPTFCV